ncbi:MAG: zinc ribbon domain-containing protein [Phycisphaerae bacterium]|nr:zinc ribbon domain-containing protein [Phycisphaerae bacterium]
MLERCPCCGEALKPRARYCGECGQEVVSLSSVSQSSALMRVAPQVAAVMPSVGFDAELAAQAQLEMHTRLSPLMNQERLKALVMAIAAHGGTGTVGYWSDC